MSGTRSDAEFTGQYPELLPARTVLSTFIRTTDGATSGNSTNPLGGLLPHIALLDKVLPDPASRPINGIAGSSGASSGGV
jgi:hypothetical protein